MVQFVIVILSHTVQVRFTIKLLLLRKKQLLKFLKILNSKIIIGFVFFFINFETLATINYVTYFNVVFFFAELLILMKL